MRIMEVSIKPFDGRRLKATAAVTFEDGLKLNDVKIINVQSEYFVIMPSRKSMLKDIGHGGLNRFFYRAVRERVLNEFICRTAR